MFHLPDTIYYVLVIAAASAFIWSYFRASNNKNNIQNAKDTIDLQNDSITALQRKSKEQDEAILASEKKIIELESEQKVIKTLPLQQLSADYHSISDTLIMIKDHLGAANKLLEKQQDIMNYFYENSKNDTFPDSPAAKRLVKTAVKEALQEGTT
jgi:hypothetical protein